jgi:hypothetical protein
MAETDLVDLVVNGLNDPGRRIDEVRNEAREQFQTRLSRSMDASRSPMRISRRSMGDSIVSRARFKRLSLRSSRFVARSNNVPKESRTSTRNLPGTPPKTNGNSLK